MPLQTSMSLAELRRRNEQTKAETAKKAADHGTPKKKP